MLYGAQRKKLRAKTGCLTCRSRRKKCDETTPVCGRCALSKRACEWPNPVDLVDRRYTAHPKSRYSDSPETDICLRSESVTCDQVNFDLEDYIARHFFDKFFKLLLLPGCHPDFFDGWIKQIRESMDKERSLHFSVLLNGASHIYNTDNSFVMKHLAMEYYSRTLRSLASTLARPRTSQLTRRNAVLSSVMLLYLHGCIGLDTVSDIQPHIKAATDLLDVQSSDAAFKVRLSFDRLALESVLYQIFLASTGYWSENDAYHKFDAHFWMRVEHLLKDSAIFPGYSISLNSPVLGIPVSLIRLAIESKHMYQNPTSYNGETLNSFRSEVDDWEATILCDSDVDYLAEHEISVPYQGYYKSTSYLYALILSLLLDHMSTSSDRTTTTRAPKLSHISLSRRWQIQKAVQILKKHRDDDEWASCYMGLWPVYTLGFFLDETDHMDLIRMDLDRRWELTRFKQVARFKADLEKIWGFRSELLPML